jgi:hypothetical protein
MAISIRSPPPPPPFRVRDVSDQLFQPLRHKTGPEIARLRRGECDVVLDRGVVDELRPRQNDAVCRLVAVGISVADVLGLCL